MAINLTLNDFRSVLGVKNDGDVVMTLVVLIDNSPEKVSLARNKIDCTVI